MPLYQADLSAGSLLLPESRVIARLLLAGADKAALDHAVRVDNVLQKSSPASAIRQARLIRLRLMSIPRPTWTLIADGDKEVATQLVFAAALKHSTLLGAFLKKVVADHHRRLEIKLSPHAWEPFLAECATQDAYVAGWSLSTRKKLLQVIIRILAEARYLDSSQSVRLLPPHIHPAVRQALTEAGELDLIRAMELKA